MSREWSRCQRRGAPRQNENGSFSGVVSERKWGVEYPGRAFEETETIYVCEHEHLSPEGAVKCAEAAKAALR